jgi:hypothetical protein
MPTHAMCIYAMHTSTVHTHTAHAHAAHDHVTHAFTANTDAVLTRVFQKINDDMPTNAIGLELLSLRSVATCQII